MFEIIIGLACFILACCRQYCYCVWRSLPWKDRLNPQELQEAVQFANWYWWMGTSGNYQYADSLCENAVPESQSERGIYSIPSQHPASIYLLFQSQQLKHQIRALCEIFSKLTIKAIERHLTTFYCLYCQLWTDFTHCSGLVFLLLTLNK